MMGTHAELFDQLARYLSGHGYSFVVDQVREELSTGRLTEEKLSTLAEVAAPVAARQSLFEADFQKGVPAEFVRRAEYTEQESVALLLEAARRAICEGEMMAREIQQQFAKEGISGITFASERDEEASFSLRFDAPSDSQQPRKTAAKLDEFARQVLKE
jgi:hypothetical protein